MSLLFYVFALIGIAVTVPVIATLIIFVGFFIVDRLMRRLGLM